MLGEAKIFVKNPPSIKIAYLLEPIAVEKKKGQEKFLPLLLKNETRAAGAGVDTCLYGYRGTWVITISIPCFYCNVTHK